MQPQRLKNEHEITSLFFYVLDEVAHAIVLADGLCLAILCTLLTCLKSNYTPIYVASCSFKRYNIAFPQDISQPHQPNAQLPFKMLTPWR